MRGSSNDADLFDPKTEMDSSFSRHGSSSSEGDFGFAFNDSNFSDRLLRIEITGGPSSDSTSDVGEGGCASIADWARHRKRRREDNNKKDNEIVACPEEQIITDNNQPDMDDNLDEEGGEAMVEEEEALSGDDDASSEPNWGMDQSTVVNVKELHISSPILAAKSPFFYKLFSNGMRESEQRHVTLRISAQEEGALMELLNFVYSNSLTVTTAPALLDVLMAADKFEVASCMRYCSRLLRNMPMTPDSALLYLDLPSTVLMAEAVQPLTDAAKQFLASRFKDITKFQEEVMALPLAGIEAILSSDDLQIASEDAVYDFVLKWARGQYSSLEDRREILGSRLALYIRFPYMTCRKLKKVLTCSDFDHEVASKQCVVYLDLKREECTGLFPSGRVYSQAFHLGGQGFFLSAHCNMDQQSSFHCFGLFLGMQEKGAVSFGVDYEFAAREKPSQDYACKYKGNYTFTGGKAVGYRNLFGIPWTSFIAEDSQYFIDGILHLRAELTIKRTDLH
ncbi:BnaC04g01060D [Brassica napus]|uniref:BnaC04g01060D protein n=1 Tax=Brassica napus TaxID=3708 RepID=A0A078HZ99_BRANA|nr:BnaC04g01060D [Brassica napus]